jgi:hypothetical protein
VVQLTAAVKAAALPPSAAIGFTLDAQAPLRPFHNTPLTFDVPQGIAYTQSVYLPVVLRQ